MPFSAWLFICHMQEGQVIRKNSLKQKTILKKLLAISYIAVTSISLFSCKNSPVEPYIGPGRRDYVWTIDTIKNPGNPSFYTQAIWGSSPNDLWAVNPNDRMFHSNGNKWSVYNYPTIYGGGETIFGFSKDNIWVGSFGGAIWHFDGTNWYLHYWYKPEGRTSVSITHIWGKNSNDIFAVGVYFKTDGNKRGFILHYDGREWRELYKADFNSNFIRAFQQDDDLLIFSYNGTAQSVTDSLAYYSFSTQGLKELYKDSEDNAGTGNLGLIGDRVYFTIGNSLYRYLKVFSEGRLLKGLTFDNPQFGNVVFGRNEKDFFVRMVDGLAHYNGSNLEYVYKFEDKTNDIGQIPLIFEKEVYFIMFNFTKKDNYVLHGKLN